VSEYKNTVKSYINDADAKNILKFRAVLASILKYAILEYNDCDWNDILDRIPVSTKEGESDLYVQEENSEDLEDRKHIDFDVLFHTKGDDPAKVSIWCDIEPQHSYMTKTDSPSSYDLVSRGVYYLARMVSRQLVSGTQLSGYRHLHKCYSIWICFDHLGDRGWIPTVSRYRFSPIKLLTGDTYPPRTESAAADLMELIIVRAGGDVSDKESLVGLVNALWRDTDKLEKYIPRTYTGYMTVNEGVSNMCDMREVGRSQGIAEGRVEGIAEGIAKGRVEEKVDMIRAMSADGVSLEKALQYAKIDYETYKRLISEYGSNPDA